MKYLLPLLLACPSFAPVAAAEPETPPAAVGVNSIAKGYASEMREI